MPAPDLYLLLPGTARQTLEHYRDVFGGELHLATAADMSRTDLPADAIAHGMLEGPVRLFAADVAPGEQSLRTEGILISLLGAAAPTTLRTWFAHLFEGGEVLDDLQVRPWGDTDGTVRDRWGLTWLIGFQGGANDADDAAFSAPPPIA